MFPKRWKNGQRLVFVSILTSILYSCNETLVRKVKVCGKVMSIGSAGLSLAPVAAFPGAEGGGANSVGGRGGRLIEVTHLNDNGTGSLRAAVETSGPRTVVFTVGGTIQLNTTLVISNPFITIAGQSAPGAGILLNGQRVPGETVEIHTHDVILRYLRVRNYQGTGGEDDAIGITAGYNIIVDHCSVSGSGDENIGIWAYNYGNLGAPKQITLSYNLVAEGLLGHSMGILTGASTGSDADQMTDIDIHHNVMISNDKRNPYVKHKTGRIINNISYNWGSWGSSSEGGNHLDFVGNLFKRGPNSSDRALYVSPRASGYTDSANGDPSVYARGNQVPSTSNPNADNWTFICWNLYGSGGCNSVPAPYRRNNPLPQLRLPITEVPVSQLQTMLIPVAGASQKLDGRGQWVSNRDIVDSRLIQDLLNGTGRLVSGQNADFVIPTGGVPYPDMDHDGMSDLWENGHGLSPSNGIDGNADSDGDGYTNVEEFLNSTDPNTANSSSGGQSGSTPPGAPGGGPQSGGTTPNSPSPTSLPGLPALNSIEISTETCRK